MNTRRAIPAIFFLCVLIPGCVTNNNPITSKEPKFSNSVFEDITLPSEVGCEIDLGEIDFLAMSPLSEDIRLFELSSRKEISIGPCTPPAIEGLIAGGGVTCGFLVGNNEVQTVDFGKRKNVSLIVRCFGRVMNAAAGLYEPGNLTIKIIDNIENKEVKKIIPLTVIVKPAFILGRHWISKENVSFLATANFTQGDTAYLTTEIENDKLRLFSVGWTNPKGLEEWFHYRLSPHQKKITVSNKLNMSGEWKISVDINGYRQFTESINVGE